jgi:transcription elongation factor GreA-like protein/transcription elongation GreA/GreB family factor
MGVMSDNREAAMSYLKDFRERIQNNDYPSFLKLWEEYCYGDQPDGEELILILQAAKESDLAKSFGLQVDRVLSLWREIKDPQQAHSALQLIFDLETSNSEELASLATEYLRNRYPDDPLFSDKMRLIGLRNRERFQGCIRNFDLLSHLKKGNFVFHTAGWGTGEILDVSLVREEVSLEFEYVVGIQHFIFEKAFKTLIPLAKEHFCARRFGDPDSLEKEAREAPCEVLRLLLHDLGPKNAAEIKEEMCDLVIPVENWNRWWQSARAKIKKDKKIESPKDLKDPFRLREEELPHEVSFYKDLESRPDTNATIQMVYTFLRDFPETLKNLEFKASLTEKLKNILGRETLAEPQRLQVLFFLEDLGESYAQDEMIALIQRMARIDVTIRSIEVLAFQKKVLQLVRKHRKDWKETFLDLFLTSETALLRDYFLHELNTTQDRGELTTKLNSLLIHPISYPEAYVWYFQKLLDRQSGLPFSDVPGQNRFFEGLLVLLDHLGQKPQTREMAKKIVALLTGDRYKVVRDIMQQSSVEEIKEYLLLATKCQSFGDHDIKILHSLAEVVHPALGHLRKDSGVRTADENILWATEAGYRKVQQRIQEIATKETVQNAREIEAARALGDFRENAEFKAALERRDRLQSELKLLSNQMSHARILMPSDVPADEVGVGSVIDCRDSKGGMVRFILLGPWDADPEKQILSFQSKLAQAMKGRTVGEKFEFQGEEFTIADIGSFFDQ